MILRGTFPSVSSVMVIDAAAIRALRLDGSPPCDEGLRAALKWIGDRSLPLGEAFAEAEQALGSDWFDWACRALGLTGSGYGSGYGDGYGCGDGYGDGSGYGSGYGDGYGCGDGYGYGSPDIVHSEPTGLATPVSA
jgi:hypothetical protein